MTVGNRISCWATTHVGARRSHNEDALVNRPDLGLWAVADGAGGHAAGEVASGMIVATLEAIPPGIGGAELLSQVRARIAATHTELRKEAERRGPDVTIASTVVVLVVREDHFACLWAGDSRAYLLRDGDFMQISHDHSLVQELVDSGAIDAAQAERHPHANIITRAVGAAMDELALEKVSDRLRPGDRFLLCSDGLNKTLSDADLAALLTRAGDEAPTDTLVSAALARQVNDNVTAVVIAYS
ncbi:MAG: serine/threonine-protein phosphatase [Rhodospirillales bacterium]|jgi:protein phosphatase/serine/threonine-protein phosphatase Stp1|nr:serine/threonine-protein phosphatase [Rhodospirillales bacterium]